VSGNPLEIARAFSAPLLAGVNPNADRAQLARESGWMAVQYGVCGEAAPADAVEEGDARAERTLCFGVAHGEYGRAPRHVATPESGATYA
jgi:hypothetical protein